MKTILPVISNNINAKVMKNLFWEHKRSFVEYADSFIEKSGEPCLKLKKDHTFRVVENTQKIIPSCRLTEEDCYCAELTALYHDIGRFDQYAKYQTFADKNSENHAHLAVKILKKHKAFLAEPKHIQKKILAAVILHNALELPAKLPDRYDVLCKIIRDADKLDILYVMAQNFTQSLPEKDSVMLHVQNNPECYTPKILEQAMKKQVIKYTDLRYENDFKILLCGWFFTLYFRKSKELLKEQGFFSVILHSLPSDPHIKEFQNMMELELKA